MTFYYCIPISNLPNFCQFFRGLNKPTFYIVQYSNGSKDLKFPKFIKEPFICIPFIKLSKFVQN